MKNKYRILGEKIIIYISHKGKVLESFIDIDDFLIAYSFPHTWQLVQGYIQGSMRHGDEVKYFKLHRLITNCPENKVVDHINHNKLDNTRKNLRVVTIAQNNQNYKIEKPSESGMRGVTWNKQHGKWRALIVLNKKRIFLGEYENLEDAKTVVSEARAMQVPYSPEATNGTTITHHAQKLKEQNKNKAQRNNKSSGIKGVSWAKSQKKWRAEAQIKGKRYLSMHDSIEDAIKARQNFIDEGTLK